GLEAEERQRIEEWVQANTVLQQSSDLPARSLAGNIIINNEDIPLIATDDSGRIIDYRNLDSTKVRNDSSYLLRTLVNLKAANPPINWIIQDSPQVLYKVYYGQTRLQQQVKYYPLVQLAIVSLFIGLLVALLTTRYKSAQNQVWAGLAKETAHQLGTPITSLRGWTELLKEGVASQELITEMEKDIDRLQLVSDRFGKIGSKPQLELMDAGVLTTQMVAYMKRRAPNSVKFIVQQPPPAIPVMASATLLNWVLENLIKNALDAMEGRGTLTIEVHQTTQQVYIDVTDTGKGIASSQLGKVFSPGFTTKKRGWGLGLTLSRRIMEQFHGGTLTVKWSAPGKRSTFSVSLPRPNA
ncbi:MAG TPA: HAMP domain-containing sensor histidine kinase, partial [Phnomibacter sp.]|nr:HAMP domain-containing sensor histidine kinase [Phnomibacter sp.]